MSRSCRNNKRTMPEMASMAGRTLVLAIRSRGAIGMCRSPGNNLWPVSIEAKSIGPGQNTG